MTSLDIDVDTIVDFVHCTAVHVSKDGFLFAFPGSTLEVHQESRAFQQKTPMRDISGSLSIIDTARCTFYAKAYLKECAKYK